MHGNGLPDLIQSRRQKHHGSKQLYRPYRKVKRTRTAFAPDQLLSLEMAFEKNHYLVGRERKELANNLFLTETQT
ncbi:unnamed protein product [Protopolystoma xenopodis]|uniref:Homeobox domain-containing protein n=1 Tax=Protopolystoma xenopodis TaxID=117903 RepID=A0A3S5B3A6_9PLAT|nr:unnamed protein product [Protopolystoma xenopodis]